MNGLYIKKDITKNPKQNTLNLIMQHKGLEVVYGNIPTKGGIIVSAYENPDLVEIIYIIEGEFQYDYNGKSVLLSSGDCFYHHDLERSFTLYATKDSKIITFSNTGEFNIVKENYQKLLKAIEKIETKDHYTNGHCLRVGLYSQKLANASKKPVHSMKELMIVANIHDLGKCKIPDEILLKPGRFNDEERQIMNNHVIYTYELLKNIYGFSESMAIMAACHHERYDGSGYPFGLKGDEIPIESRIIAIADTFDAMTTSRPYQKARTPQEAIVEMQKFSKCYDPELLSIFIELVKENRLDISELPEDC